MTRARACVLLACVVAVGAVCPQALAIDPPPPPESTPAPNPTPTDPPPVTAPGPVEAAPTPAPAPTPEPDPKPVQRKRAPARKAVPVQPAKVAPARKTAPAPAARATARPSTPAPVRPRTSYVPPQRVHITPVVTPRVAPPSAKKKQKKKAKPALKFRASKLPRREVPKPRPKPKPRPAANVVQAAARVAEAADRLAQPNPAALSAAPATAPPKGLAVGTINLPWVVFALIGTALVFLTAVGSRGLLMRRANPSQRAAKPKRESRSKSREA